MNSNRPPISRATEPSAALSIGWAEVDITPVAQPVLIAGQFPARLSEGVADPLKATACALEQAGEHVVFVCCDLIGISIELQDSIRRIIAENDFSLDPIKVIFNATHTHAGPEIRSTSGHTSVSGSCMDLGEVAIEDYVAFAAARIAECVKSAWNSRISGGISFGLDYAVIGRNRRWVNSEGISTMYGLRAPASEEFRHIEGYEDHSLNLLATYDSQGGLTGLIVNVPCPSQEQEHLFVLSADFWHETRQELRRRFGEKLFILPQVSAAGELTSHVQFEVAANMRMLELRGRTAREEIATRITNAVERILPYLEKTVNYSPCLKHRAEMMSLPLNRLTQDDVDQANEAAIHFRLEFERELKKLEAEPDLRMKPRWYHPITKAYRRMKWNLGVAERYERQKTNPMCPEEVHVVRLGEIAFATNPFEYYLDFGIQVKVRSPAIQTFLVQLAGQGTYVPSPRSVSGGGYGSVPASNPFGPEAGQILADNTLQLLRSLWNTEAPC